MGLSPATQDNYTRAGKRRWKVQGSELSAAESEVGAGTEVPVLRDGWLSAVPGADATPCVVVTQRGAGARRASHRGFLPLSLDAYLELLDWTGRRLRASKRGAIPAHLQPIPRRLAVNADCWLDTIEQFGRWFHRAVGRLSNLAALAHRRGRHWFQGQRASHLAFG